VSIFKNEHIVFQLKSIIMKIYLQNRDQSGDPTLEAGNLRSIPGLVQCFEYCVKKQNKLHNVNKTKHLLTSVLIST